MTKLNIKDKIFNRLTVKEEFGKSKLGYITWLCYCECGKQVIAVGSHIVGNKVKSCGCLNLEHCSRLGKSSYLGQNIALRNSVFGEYHQNAKRRNLPFELTREIFDFLTKLPCHYCGAVESNTVKDRLDRRRKTSPVSIGCYSYNGVDRKNSELGYTTENCVPCCKMCNIAKMDTPYQDFIDWINKAYNYLKKGE